MNEFDFLTYQFRCSGLAHLMIKPRSKIEVLSESTKTYLRDIYIQEVFGRHHPQIVNGAMQKGTMVESDSMDVLKAATGLTYFKNNKHLNNDFIKGTPDIIAQDNLVIDIKSNWDLWTFAATDEKKATDSYYYQVLGYMWLTGKTKGKLAFCLTNTPEEIMYKETQKLAWSMDQAEAEDIIRKNHTFDDVPAELRVKQFDFDYSEQDVEMLKNQIILAREYLQGMHL